MKGGYGGQMPAQFKTQFDQMQQTPQWQAAMQNPEAQQLAHGLTQMFQGGQAPTAGGLPQFQRPVEHTPMMQGAPPMQGMPPQMQPGQPMPMQPRPQAAPMPPGQARGWGGPGN